MQPFSIAVLIDNGTATLTLQSIYPTFWGADQAADFILSVTGSGFTPQSVLRWDGDARPSAFVSSYQLTATIFLTDVASVGTALLSVFDPAPSPTGTETSALTFRIVESVSSVYLPLIVK